jgi:phospholipid/cholesterol/gamma-HCH transport system substrate-binding protein
VRRVRGVIALVLALGAVSGSCSSGDDGRFQVAAEFERAVGLYPGSPVRLQGIDVGEITDIRNERGIVEVDMRLEEGTELPVDARALIVPLSLLGERYVQLGPSYEGGATLGDGDVIPVERTAVPAEIDELLEGFEDFLRDLDPSTVSSVVVNLAEIVEGQGEQLNDLLGNAAGTVELLANESDELTEITQSLAQLTSTLESRTRTLTSLIKNYEIVAGTLADNRALLEPAIVELNRAAKELAGLLTAHRDPLKADIEVLTTVGRTLQRNIDRLDVLLASTVRLFEAAGRAYDPVRNWLPLNNQFPAGQSSDAFTTAVRDRLAGVCRRLAAPLGDDAPPDLLTCGDPNSGYFDDILGAITELPGSPEQQASTLFARGLEGLPELTPEQRAQLSGSSTTTTSARPTSTTLLPGLPPVPERTQADDGSLIDRLLGWLSW